MESKFAKHEKYLSKELGINATITDAYLLKLGFVKFQFKDDSLSDSFFDSNGSDRKAVIDKHIEQLYSALLNSPHVMEISPPMEELQDEEKKMIFIKAWATERLDFLSMNEYLELRVVLPKKKREELFDDLLPKLWYPEQFTLYFNGATFAALIPATDFPVFNYIGQVAREFLAEAMEKVGLWEHLDGYGPTPIHPDFYVLVTQGNEEKSQIGKPIVSTDKKGNVFILLSNDLPVNKFTNFFLRKSMPVLEDFYSFVIIRHDLMNAIVQNEEENQDLRKLMAQYFGSSTFARLFGKVSGNIRKTLGEMHLSLLEIATLEMQLTKAKAEALNAVQASEFLNPVSDYFQKHTEIDHDFDRNAQLTTMNFAADEASNNSINQGTLFAAFLGALVGGLVTLIVQIFAK